MSNLYNFVQLIFKMLTGFSQAFYNLLTSDITLPSAVYTVASAVFPNIPRTVTTLEAFGGAFITYIVIAGIVKAVNFLW